MGVAQAAPECRTRLAPERRKKIRRMQKHAREAIDTLLTGPMPQRPKGRPNGGPMPNNSKPCRVALSHTLRPSGGSALQAARISVGRRVEDFPHDGIGVSARVD